MNDPLLKTGTPFHKKEVVVVGVMTFVLFVLKSLWALSQASDPFIPDELVYKFNARSLFDLTKYYSARYPPVYPLSLVPAFLFRNWFDIMLVLNAFWSSLTYRSGFLVSGPSGRIASSSDCSRSLRLDSHAWDLPEYFFQ